MRLNFSILFNTGYLAKGLALHQSLINTCPDFNLYIFSFDDEVHHILAGKELLNVTVVPLADVENDALLKVKAERSIAEYCWTCKPFILKYSIDNFNLDNCTYLDSDIFFYQNPNVLFEEMGNASVLINPHNYLPQYDQSAVSGIYCAGFVTFKNTTDGNRVLSWWADACIKWCYSHYEEGKWADQKYLDSWPYMFKGVDVCKNVYAGAAPWNATNYKSEHDVENIIFYHFHDLQYISDGSWFTGGYELPQIIVDKIYRPYTKLLKSIYEKTSTIDSLNTKDKSTFNVLTFKYKVGIYRIDFKAAFQNFIKTLFFIKRRRFYKNNFIK